MSYVSPLSPASVIEYLAVYGHLRYPFGHQQDLPADISTLKLTDAPVREALRSHQSFDLNYHVMSGAYRQQPSIATGELGPVTSAMIASPRCGCPDYRAQATHDELPAIGTGSWKGCHSIGNFHCAKIHVTNSPPGFLAPVWDEVKRRVTQSYEELGLRWIFDAPNGGHQTSLTFYPRSNGWIGLAIVGQGESCSSQPIWLRLLETYKGGSTPDQITSQWTTLTKHELGHNCGLDHSRGGVMNPSIVDGLPVSWRGDPSETQLKRWFGGEPVPGSNPEPEPPPPGDDDEGPVVSGRLMINGRPYLLVRDPGYSGM